VGEAGTDLSLTERAQQAWASFLAAGEKPQVDPIGTPFTGVKGTLTEWEEIFFLSQDRASRYSDFALMDEGHVAAMVDAVVRAALKFDGNEAPSDILSENDCFKVHMEGYGTSGPRQVIAQVLEDTDLRFELRSIARDTLVFGDVFLEILVDDNGNIVELMPYPTEQMVVKRNSRGRLEEGADEQERPLAYRQISPTGAVLGAWYPHEMLHIKYMPDKKLSYSRKSLLDDHRKTWKRVDWIEQSIVIGRVARAYLRLIHYIDVTNKSIQDARKMLSDYIRAFTMKVTPSGVAERSIKQPEEDVYVTTGYLPGPDGRPVAKLNRIDAVDPRNDGLANINDLKHFTSKMFDKVPGQMLGVQESTSTELTDQELAFGDLVADLQKLVLEKQLIRKVFDYALRLKGYDPKKCPYVITWPSPIGTPSWRLADAQFRLSLKFASELENGATSRLHYRMRVYGETQEQAEAVLTQWEKELKRFGPINKGSDTALRVAGNQSAGLDPADEYINETVKEILHTS
jgi:hypothetical protein